MRAKQEGETLVFELEGHLDFESTLEFEKTASVMMEERNATQLVLNLSKLRFVGSSGISQFIGVLKDFSKNRQTRTKLCNLSAEFSRMFRVYQTARKPFEVYTDEAEALASFLSNAPPKRSNAKPALDH